MCCYIHNLYNNAKKNIHALWSLNFQMGAIFENYLQYLNEWFQSKDFQMKFS